MVRSWLARERGFWRVGSTRNTRRPGCALANRMHDAEWIIAALVALRWCTEQRELPFLCQDWHACVRWSHSGVLPLAPFTPTLRYALGRCKPTSVHATEVSAVDCLELGVCYQRFGQCSYYAYEWVPVEL